jgi:predicted RNA-binding Zn-ribbon protein involved in translation (DUF1610 family)
MTAAVQIKRCTKCQKDLTGIKRLKDPKGQYWCPECGVGGGDASTSGSGLVSPCPKCQTPVHAAQLIREAKSGTYMCENCAAGIKVKGGGGAVRSEEDASKRKKLILGVTLLVGGIVAYFVLSYVLG